MLARAIGYGLLLACLPREALAWGLDTHLYFAQQALLAAPLADPALQRAVLRLPRFVLAGACLPDLALVGRVVGTHAFRRTHRWATLRRLAAIPDCDEHRALVVGYASHLLADVIAHNHFVPDHERRIARVAHVTHAVCEWAMDRLVEENLQARVADLLLDAPGALADFTARGFDCPLAIARRALTTLARGDRALRASRLPLACVTVLRRFDRAFARRAEIYLSETTQRLAQLGRLLDGAQPRWDAEPRPWAVPVAFWRRGRPVLPLSVFDG
jgi:Zinc dependent phospholipase C